MAFTASFFTRNRAQLKKRIEKDAFIVLFSNDSYPLNGDQFYPYRQQSDLFYFTGIKQEETILILAQDIEILFLLKPEKSLETWEGKKLQKKDATTISGIEKILWINNFENELQKAIQKHKEIYLLGKKAFSSDTQLIHNHRRWYKNIIKKNIKLKDARSLIDPLRLIKSKEEIDMMQKAINITDLAFQEVLDFVRPGVKESDVEALITYIFKKNGANRHAYQPIIASGENACYLHYVKNNDVLKDGDLLLMDFGAEYNYYAADLSRTIPVNGQFTKEQRKWYALVLSVQKKAIALFTPGTTINKINQTVELMMQEAMIDIGLLKQEAIDNQSPDNPLYKNYYMHGVTHFLGIDVHDVGTKDTVLKDGMVLTCEPGIYIREKAIGIRIENNIIVGNTPIDLTKDIIRDIDEIENELLDNL